MFVFFTSPLSYLLYVNPSNRFLRHKHVDLRLYEMEGRGATRSPNDCNVMEMTSPLDEESHPLQEKA